MPFPRAVEHRAPEGIVNRSAAGPDSSARPSIRRYLQEDSCAESAR